MRSNRWHSRGWSVPSGCMAWPGPRRRTTTRRGQHYALSARERPVTQPAMADGVYYRPEPSTGVGRRAMTAAETDADLRDRLARLEAENAALRRDRDEAREQQ